MKRIDSFEVGEGSGRRLVTIDDAETTTPSVVLGIDSSFSQRQSAPITLERLAELVRTAAAHFESA